MNTSYYRISPNPKKGNSSPKCPSPVGYDCVAAIENAESNSENNLLVSQSEEGQRNLEKLELNVMLETVDENTVKKPEPSESKNQECQEVIWSITFAMAIPKGEEDDPVIAIEKAKKKAKQAPSNAGLVEAPKAQGYYHIEYNLLPDDPEPMKVDVVMFGLAAKIYMNNETKALKPWQEKDQMWLGWRQSVKLRVTRERLIKLASHSITFRVWDTKDRVSAKAKYDRPKAFRLPQGRCGEDPDHVGGIKNMVQKLRSIFEKENPKTGRSVKRHRDSAHLDIKELSELNCVAAEPKLSATEAVVSERVSSFALCAEGEDVCHNRSLGRIAEQDLLPFDSKNAKLQAVRDPLKPTTKKSCLVQSLEAEKQLSKTTIPPVKSSSARDKSLVAPKEKSPGKPAQESVASAEDIRRNGVASAELNPAYLLAGGKSITDRLVTLSSGVNEGYCNIAVDKALISEELKVELNPLVITVVSATSLPDSPVPFHLLQERCVPVYCRYKFHNVTEHRTKGHRQAANIYFKDVNVIMTSLLSPGELRESLGGPPMEIQVHDRDRKMEEASCGPALFGTQSDDDKLSSVGLVTMKSTRSNPFHQDDKPYDPYGVAEVDLSDLLRGQKHLKVTVPIRCSPAPRLSDNERGSEWKDQMFGLTEAPMAMGQYFDANSSLKVQIDLACPLTKERGGLEGRSSDRPFGRIVYLSCYDNSVAPNRLRSEILRINAAAFQLDSYTEETVMRALGCYKMNSKERESRDLDVLTGFHVVDGQIHLFVLEGLKHKAIERLWETVLTELPGMEEGRARILYNTELSFSKRLYDDLDLSLAPIHLHEPLEIIMRQPLVYVRDMVPQDCFQALSRLSHLLHVRKMMDLVRNNLFPSAKMILSMSREFGTVPAKGEQSMKVKSQREVETSPEVAIAKSYKPLDTYNVEYVKRKQAASQEPQTEGKDFIQANIEAVHQASLRSQRPKQAVIAAHPPVGKAAHNYSTQMANSTEQARELLRKEMGKDPTRRFTYSQEYQSATVDPVDHLGELKSAEARSRASWLSQDGFTYPGFRSSIESNTHPLHPSEARMEELKKPWRENVLHGNILRPTLTRETWPWLERFHDFELYKKPSKVFGPEAPVTIHLAGHSLQQEQLQAASAQYSRWLRKVLPDRGSTEGGPAPEFKCHVAVGNGGKLQDLLKDKPMKYSLRKPGMVLRPIPAVSVVQHPEALGPEDVEKEVNTAFSPGLLQGRSLSWDGNAIPRHKSEHDEYHFTRTYWEPRTFRYKRTAPPLTDEERRTSPFRPPPPPTKTQTATSVHTQPARHVVETRTYKDVFMHVL